ncbi:MAG TPA: hypothetical protein V6D17_01495 [Candidatus Obscuribacterales bacterium]
MNQQQDLRIGELLVEMGFLRPADLDEAINIAQQTRLPLGSVLVMSGNLTDKELRAALLGQSLLKDDVISKQDMFSVMRTVRERHVSFEEAMKLLEGVTVAPRETNRLGELVLAAGWVSQEQLDEALTTVESSGLPLGRVLVLTGLISEGALKTAIDMQVAIRDGSVSRDEGIEKLHGTSSQLSVARTSRQMAAPALDKILRLGDFFVKAGVISESDMLNALEVALTSQKRIGEVLLQFNLITSTLLESALELQHLVRTRMIRPDQAITALQNVYFHQMTIHQALGINDPDQFIAQMMGQAQTQSTGVQQADPQQTAVAPAAQAQDAAPSAVPVGEAALSETAGQLNAQQMDPGGAVPAAPQLSMQPTTQYYEAAQSTQQGAFADAQLGDRAAAGLGQWTGSQAAAFHEMPAAQTRAEQPQTTQSQAVQMPYMTMPATQAPLQEAAPMQAQADQIPSVPAEAPMPAQADQIPSMQATPAGVSMQAQADQLPSMQAPPVPAPTGAVEQQMIAQSAPVVGAASMGYGAASGSVAPGVTTSTETAVVVAQEMAMQPNMPPGAAYARTQPAIGEGDGQSVAAQTAPVTYPTEAANQPPYNPPMQPMPVTTGGPGQEERQELMLKPYGETDQQQPNPGMIGLSQLLRVSGIVTQDDIDKAIQEALTDSVLLHQILNASGVADPITLRAAYDAHRMVLDGHLAFEHAMIALDYCKRGKVSLYEAFHQLGWLK